jgi:hypothetical protein
VLVVDQYRCGSGEVVLYPKFLPVTYAETGVVAEQNETHEHKELPQVYFQRTAVLVSPLVGGIGNRLL